MTSSFRLPRLTVSAPKLEMEKSKDSMSDHLSAPNLYTTTMTEFVASFAIVQLLLRSTDAVLGKVGLCLWSNLWLSSVLLTPFLSAFASG